MTAARGAAALDEQAELAMLRDQVDRSATDAARTLAELDRRLTSAARPRQVARWLAASVRVTAARALRGEPGESGRPGALRPVLAALPVLVVAGALCYAVARRKLSARPDRR